MNQNKEDDTERHTRHATTQDNAETKKQAHLKNPHLSKQREGHPLAQRQSNKARSQQTKHVTPRDEARKQSNLCEKRDVSIQKETSKAPHERREDDARLKESRRDRSTWHERDQSANTKRNTRDNKTERDKSRNRNSNTKNKRQETTTDARD